MSHLRSWLLLLLLLLLAVMASRPTLQAARQRNAAGNALLHGLNAASADCSALTAGQIIPRLERAVALQPDSAAAWLLLLRVRGLTDRPWLIAHAAELPGAATLEPVLAELAPAHMNPAWDWDASRCSAAWDAWTVALIHSQQGRWDEAAAFYQIGLGLAPGRVPAAIMNEYYQTLQQGTNHLLSSANAALPIGSAPQWTLTQGATIARDGYHLLGFDLDAALLDAGGEVLATLYWQDAAGNHVYQPLRTANLWPNSGNAWQQAGDFWPCLPGYTEPGWLTQCASASGSAPGAANPVGLIRHDPQQSADSYIVTASAQVQAGADLLVGGRWLNAGDFPSAHLAAQSADDQYTVLLDLSGLPPKQWQAIAGSAGQAATQHDLVWWLRPRNGTGAGDFYFDDVFLFALPADFTVTPAHE